MKRILSVLALGVILYSCSPKLSPDHDWNDKKWVLVEMDNNPVQLSGTDKDAHLIFNATEKTYSGSGGCNRIRGSYTMSSSSKGEISFSKGISTKMACPDLAFEDKFLGLLATTSQYALVKKNCI